MFVSEDIESPDEEERSVQIQTLEKDIKKPTIENRIIAYQETEEDKTIFRMWSSIVFAVLGARSQRARCLT